MGRPSPEIKNSPRTALTYPGHRPYTRRASGTYRGPHAGTGKTVRIRRSRAAVTGNERRNSHFPTGREGAVSRVIRKPEYLFRLGWFCDNSRESCCGTGVTMPPAPYCPSHARGTGVLCLPGHDPLQAYPAAHRRCTVGNGSIVQKESSCYVYPSPNLSSSYCSR